MAEITFESALAHWENTPEVETSYDDGAEAAKLAEKKAAAIAADAEKAPTPNALLEVRHLRKAFPIKPMSVEEAILQMNLLDHQFYVFLDSSTDKVSVVYARKDGGYGLIIPDTD